MWSFHQTIIVIVIALTIYFPCTCQSQDLNGIAEAVIGSPDQGASFRKVAPGSTADVDIREEKDNTENKQNSASMNFEKMQDDVSKRKKKKVQKITIGKLRPLHLPEPTVFTDWQPNDNQTIHLDLIAPTTDHNDKDPSNYRSLTLNYATGSVPLPKRTKRKAFHEYYHGTSKQNGDKNLLDLGDPKQLYQFLTYERSLLQSRILDEKRNDAQNSNVIHRNQVADVSFSVISNMLHRHEVQAILQLLNEHDRSFFDDDPDTVDSMPTYEIFVDTPWIQNPDPNTPKYREITQQTERAALRSKLQQILLPVIQNRIQPFVQFRFPNLCKRTTDRNCMACYSLIRRYKENERISHPPHNDGHAIVTAVTSLSDYDKDYRGGLYVISPNSLGIREKKAKKNRTSYGTIPKEHPSISNNLRYLRLNAGDTIVHTSALYHGVKVHNKKIQPETTERWSWILWFHDNSDTNCHADHSKEWYKDCAEREVLLNDNDDDINDDDNTIAICQQIYATKVQRNEEKFYWNVQAAMNGGSLAAVKIAHFFRYDIRNFKAAKFYYDLAIEYHDDPDAHYGLAEVLLYEMGNMTASSANATKNNKKKKISQQKMQQTLKAVVYHLESAAMGGNVLAMFNLGIAHTYGYGMYDQNNHPMINFTIAAEWFVESGLPEGYYAASFQAASMNNETLQKKYMQRAMVLGYAAPWRKSMRQHTGSGRLAHVDMNLQWPISHDGRKPPEF